jgi:hypothetical protein
MAKTTPSEASEHPPSHPETPAPTWNNDDGTTTAGGNNNQQRPEIHVNDESDDYALRQFLSREEPGAFALTSLVSPQPSQQDLKAKTEEDGQDDNSGAQDGESDEGKDGKS